MANLEESMPTRKDLVFLAEPHPSSLTQRAELSVSSGMVYMGQCIWVHDEKGL